MANAQINCWYDIITFTIKWKEYLQEYEHWKCYNQSKFQDYDFFEG
jgi:hypothetical protein